LNGGEVCCANSAAGNPHRDIKYLRIRVTWCAPIMDVGYRLSYARLGRPVSSEVPT
jgi:hypothetical protein